MGAMASYRAALVLAVPTGVVVGALAGSAVALSALLRGSDLNALYLVGFGAFVGLVAAAVALGGGAGGAYLSRDPRHGTAVQRVAIIAAAGLAVAVATFLFGVLVLGYGGQAGGAYLWTIAAALLGTITWISATLLTSNAVTRLLRRRQQLTPPDP